MPELYFCPGSLSAQLICFHENDTLKFHNTHYTTCYYYNVGVQEFTAEDALKVYPNPFSDFTTIQFKNVTPGKSFLSIYDMKGQLIREYKNITSDKIELQKGSLDRGIYIMKVTTGERQDVVKLVVE